MALSPIRGRGLVLIVLAALLPAGPAAAAPYWVAWEGDDYPENDGWTRVTDSGGGAIRGLTAGTMSLDGRRGVEVVDFYEVRRPLDPSASEEFVFQWRVRIDDVASSHPYDVSLAVRSDHANGVGFQMAENRLVSVFEATPPIAFAPGIFHTFEFRSRDMATYGLWIDDELRLEGSFVSVAGASRIGWGDGIQGAASLSTWDYVAFGVVPEPSALWLFATGVLVVVSTRLQPPIVVKGESNETLLARRAVAHAERAGRS